MLTAACLAIALAALVGCGWFSYWVGYTRKLRADEGFRFGKAEGYRIGIIEGEQERDQLREQLEQVNDALDELGALIDTQVAERFIPAITKAVEVDAAYEEARALTDSTGGGR